MRKFIRALKGAVNTFRIRMWGAYETCVWDGDAEYAVFMYNGSRYHVPRLILEDNQHERLRDKESEIPAR